MGVSAVAGACKESAVGEPEGVAVGILGSSGPGWGGRKAMVKETMPVMIAATIVPKQPIIATVM